MLPEINTNDIRYAEKILFGRAGVFDRERINYIKNLTNIDLQAVPGSGKTTALLAKLLILERYLPFNDDSGILVLSHTNTAIEEIKEHIGEYCPRLFRYPNYIGTIQSFIDQFLAIPYFKNIVKSSHFRIDDQIYKERIESELKFCLKGFSRDIYNKILYIYRANAGLIYKYRFGFNEENKVTLLKEMEGKELEIKKPRGNTRAENYVDYTEKEKTTIKKYLKKLKKRILQSGVLCYDDAYFLAEFYMIRFPEIKKVIQNRFKLVFVDEMQDMDTHQYRLLDELFHMKRVKNHVFQRIGDKNQAIYSSSAKTGVVWMDRNKVLKFNGSQRLSPQIAGIVKYFGVNYIDIKGRNKNFKIPPILIRFSEGKHQSVLQKFTEIVKEYRDDSKIQNIYNKPIKAIGWSTANDDPNKLGIEDYFDKYSRITKGKVIDFESLKSYINSIDTSDNQFKPIRDVVINAFLKVLRLERITIDKRQFSKQKLLRHLKENFPDTYEDFKVKIFNWSLALINEDDDVDVHSLSSAYFRHLLEVVFEKTVLSRETENFITSTNEQELEAQEEKEINEINSFEANNVKIEIGTIHSVKGETHYATLYMETCYYKHESDKSYNQLLQNKVVAGDNKTTKEAAKMMYVGLSRPTTILAYAACRSRISDEMKTKMEAKGWRIEEIK